MTNQTVTLDAKVVDQVIDALDAGYTPGLKDALKVLRAAKADSRTGETTMTTLQEASTKALDALRKAMRGNLDFDVALEAFEALRTALAQQREQQPVCHGCGIPAGDVHMSTCKSGKWPSRVSNGDTAAPAPQAQDKRDNYLSGYCTGRTDLLKEQSAQPVAQPLTDKRISWLWSESHNDTTDRMAFQVFARAIEAAHGIREVNER